MHCFRQMEAEQLRPTNVPHTSCSCLCVELHLKSAGLVLGSLSGQVIRCLTSKVKGCFSLTTLSAVISETKWCFLENLLSKTVLRGSPLQITRIVEEQLVSVAKCHC